MSALAGQPWRANAAVRVTNGTGTRHFRVGFSVADEFGDGDVTDWEGDPGSELLAQPFNDRVHLFWESSNPTLAPPQATVGLIEARIPGTSTVISQRFVGINGDSGSVEVRFFFDSDPFGSGGANPPRSGMVEWFLSVERETGLDQWGPLDSRGGFANPGVGRSHDWAAGYARARPTLTGHTLSNVGIGGAEPALFAYPDPVYVRATVDAQFFSSDTMILLQEQAAATIRSESQAGAGPNFDFEEDSVSERVDGDFAVGGVDLLLRLDFDTFGGDDEYAWAAAGHQAGWTRVDDRDLSFAARFQVDPTLTIVDETLDEPATTVFNRGEDAGGTFEVHNARDETFTPLGVETVDVVRVADGTVEDPAAVSRADGVTSWDVTFGTAGNVAPADTVGDAKQLRWDDVAGGVDTGQPTSAPIGLLSSLLDAAIHLQLNDGALDPALSTMQRLTSDLGFYSVRVVSRRGQGIDGATVTDHLRDDNDLVAAGDRTDTTTTVNGHVGWLPLKAWDSALPGGLWDHWTDAGTFEGNTFEKSRLAGGFGDFTLLAKNPNFVVHPGAGSAVAADNGDHWHPGEDLIAGLAIYDLSARTSVAVDLDAAGDPRAFAVLARFNVTLGRAETLAADRQTWTAVTGATAHEHPLMASPGDANAYVTTFDAADTATWDAADLFILGVGYIGGTPYGLQNLVPVLATANSHDGYAVDPVLLGLHGHLSTR